MGGLGIGDCLKRFLCCFPKVYAWFFFGGELNTVGRSATSGCELSTSPLFGYPSPRVIDSQEDWKFFAGGAAAGYGIREDGSLWGWGSGLLGDGTFSASSVPVYVSPGPWKHISTMPGAPNATLAIKEDGTMWAWGENSDGRLGLGRKGQPPGTSAPKAVLSSSISRVDCGGGGMYSKTPAVSFFYKNSDYYWSEIPGPGGGALAEATMSYSLYGYWIVVENAGSGYTSIPTVRVVEQQSPPEQEASVSLTVRFAVVSVEVQSGGSGYTAPPVVTIPGASGFQATASISGGSITAIEIQAPGSVDLFSTGDGDSQRTLPVTITGDGVDALAIARLGNGFIVGGHVSSAGSGYRSPISLEVAGNGKVSCRSNGKVVGVKIHSGGSEYTNGSTKVLSVGFIRDPQDAFPWGSNASGTVELAPAQATIAWDGDLSSYIADPFFTGRSGKLNSFSIPYSVPSLVSLEARIVGGGLSWDDGIPVAYSGGYLSYDGSSDYGFYSQPYIQLKLSTSTTVEADRGSVDTYLYYEGDDPRKAIEDAWDVEYSRGGPSLGLAYGVPCRVIDCLYDTITKESGDLVEFVNSLTGEAAITPQAVGVLPQWWQAYNYSTISGDPELTLDVGDAEYELLDVFDGTAYFNVKSSGSQYRRASLEDLPPVTLEGRCGTTLTLENKKVTVDATSPKVTLSGHVANPYTFARSVPLPGGAFGWPKSSPGRAFFVFGDGREQGCFSVGADGIQVHLVGGYWTKEPAVVQIGGSIPVPQQVAGEWKHCDVAGSRAVSKSGDIFAWSSDVPWPESIGRPVQVSVEWNKDSVPSGAGIVKTSYEMRGYRNYWEPEINQRFFTMSPPQYLGGSAARVLSTKRLCYEYDFYPAELPNDYFVTRTIIKSSDEKEGFGGWGPDGQALVSIKYADFYLNDFSTPPLTVFSAGSGYHSPPEILFSPGGEPLASVSAELADVPPFVKTQGGFAMTGDGGLWSLSGGSRIVDFDYKIVARKATFESSPLSNVFGIKAKTSQVYTRVGESEYIWRDVSPFFRWIGGNYSASASNYSREESPVNHETVESIDAVVGYAIVFDNGGSGFDNYSTWTVRVTLPPQLAVTGAFPNALNASAPGYAVTTFGPPAPPLPEFPDEKGYKLARYSYDEGVAFSICKGGSPSGSPPSQSSYKFPKAELSIPSSCSHKFEEKIVRTNGAVHSFSVTPWLGSLFMPYAGPIILNSTSPLDESPTIEFLCTSGSGSYESLPSYRVIPIRGYLQSTGGQQKVDGSWSDFQIESGKRKLYKFSFPTFTGFPAPGAEAEFVKTDGFVGLKSDGSLWTLGAPAVSPSRVMGNLELKVASPGKGYKSPALAEIPQQHAGVAKATATFDGKVVAVGIDNQGTGYRSPPQLTVPGGAQLQAVILGPVDSVTVTNGGSGYKNPPRVIFSTPGVSASGKASMKGSVASVRVVSGGEGYSAPPTISMGGNATATATIKGYIQSVIVNAGGLYSSAPSVSFSGGGGSGATAVAVMTRSGDALRISSVVVTNAGSGYTSSPAVSFSGVGSGGSATAVLNASVDSVSLTSGGGGYGDHPTVTVDGSARTQAKIAATCSLEVDSVSVVNGGSYRSAPTASFEAVGEISSVSLTSGGEGYSSTPEVKILGGLGSGATAACTISASIQSFVVTNGGSGYLYPPYVLINGGRRPNQSTQAKATAVLEGGSIASISVDAGGSGYYEQPTVAFKFPEPAIANASVSNGSVSGVEVLSGGYWYTDPPRVVFEGTGAGAAATAQVQNGVVTSVNITSGGSGYSTPPKVIFSIPQGGRGARAAAVLSGVVDSIALVSCGINYDQDALPEVLFIGGGGSGAAASLSVAKSGSGGTATTTINGSVIYAKIINQGSGYQDEPTVTVSDSTNFILQKASQDYADGAIGEDEYNEIKDSSKAVVRAGIAGKVTSIAIDSGGANYANASGRVANQHGERKPKSIFLKGPTTSLESSGRMLDLSKVSVSSNAGPGGSISSITPDDTVFVRKPSVHFSDTVGVKAGTRLKVSSIGIMKGSPADTGLYGYKNFGSDVDPFGLLRDWDSFNNANNSNGIVTGRADFGSDALGCPDAMTEMPSAKCDVLIHFYDISIQTLAAYWFAGRFVRKPKVAVESSLGSREVWLAPEGAGVIGRFEIIYLPAAQKHSGDFLATILDPGVIEITAPTFEVTLSGGAVVSVAAFGPAKINQRWGGGELVVHGGGGAGASLSFSISDEVMTVYVTSGGSGYTSSPSVKWVPPQQAYGHELPGGESAYPADDSKWKATISLINGTQENGYIGWTPFGKKIEYATGSSNGRHISTRENYPITEGGLYPFFNDGFVASATMTDAGAVTQNYEGAAFLKHYTSPPTVTVREGLPEEPAAVQASVVKWTDRFSGMGGLCVAVRDTQP